MRGLPALIASSEQHKRFLRSEAQKESLNDKMLSIAVVNVSRNATP